MLNPIPTQEHCKPFYGSIVMKPYLSPLCVRLQHVVLGNDK